jgi:hypothetical protein
MVESEQEEGTSDGDLVSRPRARSWRQPSAAWGIGRTERARIWGPVVAMGLVRGRWTVMTTHRPRTIKFSTRCPLVIRRGLCQLRHRPRRGESTADGSGAQLGGHLLTEEAYRALEAIWADQPAHIGFHEHSGKPQFIT